MSLDNKKKRKIKGEKALCKNQEREKRGGKKERKERTSALYVKHVLTKLETQMKESLLTFPKKVSA